MNRKIDLSIIIPLYNEESNVAQLVYYLNKNIVKLKDINVEILFVDDGSSDDTFELLKKSSHKAYSARILKLSKNFGSHGAMRAGIYHAKGHLTTMLYGDLQVPFEVIEKMLEKIKNKYNVVIASRNRNGANISKRFFSRLYAELIRKFVFPNFPKSNYDMVMFDEKVRRILNQSIELHSSLFLQIFDLGFKQAVISYSKRERLYGKSKWTLTKKTKLFIDSFIVFSYAPIRFISLTGILLSVLGLLWAVYVIVRAIFVKDIQPGWPTLIGVLMIGFGLTNISLGIIAEYMWRTFDASRHKPAFIIDKVITLK